MKWCYKCKAEKAETEFYKDCSRGDGLQPTCKDCVRAHGKSPAGKRANKAAVKKYRATEKGRATIGAFLDEYKTSGKRKESLDRYNASEKGKATKRRHSTGPKKKAYDRWYQPARCRVDPVYRLSKRCRSRLYRLVKGKPNGSAVRDLGCTVEDFKAYVETLFQPGMSWNNWSRTGWHLDHIRPLSSFDLTDREQCAQAFHYTNLQPLWAKDNLAKGDRLDWKKAS